MDRSTNVRRCLQTMAACALLVAPMVAAGCGDDNETLVEPQDAGSDANGGSAGVAGHAGDGGSTGKAGAAGSSGKAGSGGSAGVAGSSGTAGMAGSGGSAGTAGAAGSAGGTGATFYVSFTSGSDSNPGTPDLPWKNCPGMIGWSGSALLTPGDTVYFKNTDAWSYTLNASYSAFLVLEGGVTYDGSTWGSGAHAVFDISMEGSYIQGTSVLFDDDDVSYETVYKGFKITPSGKVSAVTCNYPAASQSLTGAAKRIQSCVIDGIDQELDVDVYCIAISSGYGGHDTSNVEILDNTIYDCSREGIYIYKANEDNSHYVSNVTIRSNECYANGRASTSYGAGIKLKNYVKDSIVEHNYVHNNHGTGMAFDGNYANGPQNNSIRYNLVMNGDAATGKNIAFWIDVPSSTTISADIYGNIFWNPAFLSGIFLNNEPTATLKIYNNIIYGNGAAVHTVSSKTSIDLQNNILISTSGSGSILADDHNVVGSHASNIYHRDSGSTLVSINNGQTVYDAGSLASWEPSAFSTGPTFKSASSLPTGFSPNHVPNSDGLSIVSGDPIGHGTNLGPPYDNSINGVLRGTTWDIGPYQTP
jgi:hypothetical protein